jgi:hypothetical protein
MLWIIIALLSLILIASIYIIEIQGGILRVLKLQSDNNRETHQLIDRLIALYEKLFKDKFPPAI